MTNTTRTLLGSLAVLGLLVISGHGMSLADQTDEAVAPVKAQTLCPVMGGEIDRNLYVDHKGERIYFCCASCQEKFGEDPPRYLKKLAEQGVTLETTPQPQTHCPVMGGQIDKSVFADFEGERVYFCCLPCQERFQADPRKYVQTLEAAGITLEKLPGEKEKQGHKGAQSEQ